MSFATLPKLTDSQKEELAKLEPALKSCVKTADLEKAKKITAKIQNLLRPTGHETRLLQVKNWLYATALEANMLNFAKMGFEGTIKKCSSKTRLFLEANSMLAICYLRESNIEKARELIQHSVDSINNIKSDKRREQFHRRLISRLEDESIIAGLIDKNNFRELDIEKIDAEAIYLIRNKSENQILLELGKSIPEKSINFLEEVRDAYSHASRSPNTI